LVRDRLTRARRRVGRRTLRVAEDDVDLVALDAAMGVGPIAPHAGRLGDVLVLRTLGVDVGEREGGDGGAAGLLAAARGAATRGGRRGVAAAARGERQPRDDRGRKRDYQPRPPPCSGTATGVLWHSTSPPLHHIARL